MKKWVLFLMLYAGCHFAPAQTSSDIMTKAWKFKEKMNYDSTIHYMQLAEDLYPDDEVVQYFYAMTLADFNHYSEALVKLNELMKRQAKLPFEMVDGMIELTVESYLCLDSLDRGFAIMEDALLQRPHSTDLLKGAGHYYFSVSRFEEAKTKWMQAYVQDPSDSWVTYFVGKAFYFLGDTVTAFEFFNKTLELEKTDDHFPMAPFVYCFNGEHQRAIKEMKTLVKKDVHTPLNLASVYGILGMKEKCLSTLLKSKKYYRLGSYFYFTHGTDFNCLRSEPEFIKLLSTFKDKQPVR